MNEVTILSYLSQALEQTYVAVPWKIEWHSDQAYIQITLQYQDTKILPKVENKTKKIEPEHSSPIVYELYLTVYDQTRLNGGFDSSFLNFPCGPEGVSIGHLNALIQYIRRMAHRLEAAWLEMTQEGIFQLIGPLEEINDIVDAMKRKGTYNQQKLFFPSERR